MTYKELTYKFNKDHQKKESVSPNLPSTYCRIKHLRDNSKQKAMTHKVWVISSFEKLCDKLLGINR